MKNKVNIRYLTTLSVLVAIEIIFAFTPLGYLKVGVIELTFMTLPVIVGAAALGPAAGAVLGAVFGITSFAQCFGMSAFGVALLAINPVFTFIVCLVPRVLTGWLGGLVFKAVAKFDKTKLLSYLASSVATPLLNTVLFTGTLMLLFWTNGEFIAKMTEWAIPVDAIGAFVVAFVGMNGLIEAGVCAVVGTIITKALSKIFK
ncbi:MAG: ECF transporter S component [Oscillospiraceae bacterium]